MCIRDRCVCVCVCAHIDRHTWYGMTPNPLCAECTQTSCGRQIRKINAPSLQLAFQRRTRVKREWIWLWLYSGFLSSVFSSEMSLHLVISVSTCLNWTFLCFTSSCSHWTSVASLYVSIESGTCYLSRKRYNTRRHIHTHLCFCLCVCLSLSVCLSVSLSVCLSVSLY